MPTVEPARLLILGGTAEAAALARAARQRFGAALKVTSSLAGRTRRPTRPPGRVRVGGFGGAAGLERYLCEAALDMVVDATHPFAAAISANARAACEAVAVPRLMLIRPMWRRAPDDRWVEVDDAAAAAAALRRLEPRGGERRVMLTLGLGGLEAFADMADCWFLVRLIEPPRRPLPLARFRVVVGRGPFTVEGERALMAGQRIGVVLGKASGGAATEAKIVAARELGLPVIMLRRPAPEPGEKAASVAAALDWIARRLDGAAAPAGTRVAAP
ncbi:MAG: cobalt-precorrin-6A reductase [Kiloniellales bacterium]